MKKQSYFSGLNYSLANEDPTFELAIAQNLRPQSICAISGSGMRALTLLVAQPQKMTILDVSPEQIALAKLRLAGLKSLDFVQYSRFWGYPPHTEMLPAERQATFADLPLDEPTRQIMTDLFERNSWASLLYQGKWEKTFKTASSLCQKLFPREVHQLFAFKDLAAQRAWLATNFPRKRWNFIIALMGNSTFFNAMLYRGHFVKKNIPKSHYAYFRDAYQHLLTRKLARTSFFLQLSLLGEIRYQEGNPTEAQPSLFDAMKKGANSAEIEFRHTDIFTHASDHASSYDLISMSDVPSYLSGDLEHSYLQKLSNCLRPGAVVAQRNFLRIPQATNRHGFTSTTEDFSNAVHQEGTQVYRLEALRYY